MTHTILIGDAREQLATLPDQSVQCVVTSPPYFGLRDYKVAGQIGLERTVDEYVEAIVAVFREIWRVLKDDGTCWVNLGDSYANDGKWGGSSGGKHVAALHGDSGIGRGRRNTGLKSKDLIGIPWRIAFALQADGWYLRQDIIWSKPNPMPESVRDRCTKSHEYIFLLSKSTRYFYDAAAISEPVTISTIERLSQPNLANQAGSDRVPGKTNGAMKAVPPASHRGSHFDRGKTSEHQLGRAQKGPRFGGNKYGNDDSAQSRTKSGNEYHGDGKRNKRSVWTVSTKPYAEAHFATFPPEIPATCIKAGSREGDTVLDPFAGSGTTGEVAEYLGRRVILIELNPAYRPLIEQRLAQRTIWDALAPASD